MVTAENTIGVIITTTFARGVLGIVRPRQKGTEKRTTHNKPISGIEKKRRIIGVTLCGTPIGEKNHEHYEGRQKNRL
jgi:hypothetical protein